MGLIQYEEINDSLSSSILSERENLIIINRTLAPYVHVFKKTSSSHISDKIIEVCNQTFPHSDSNVFYAFVCFLLVTKCKVSKSVGLESYIDIHTDDSIVLSIRSNSKGHDINKPILNFSTEFTTFLPQDSIICFDYNINLKEELFGLASDDYTVEIDSAKSLMLHIQYFANELKTQINAILMN